MFEPMFHLFYLMKKNISFNNSILGRVPHVLTLKNGEPYEPSVIKTISSLGTLPKIELKAFVSIWYGPDSNR